MKKYLYLILCLLSFCFINNVKALKVTGNMAIPTFDAYISNEAGAYAFDSNNETINIPYNTQIKLVTDTYKTDTSIIEYNGVSNYSIKNSDIKLVNDTFEKEEGYKLESSQKFTMPADSKMYKGPSDIFFDELGVVIPTNTEIEYEYIDVITNNSGTEKFVYTTYNGVSGWVFTSTIQEDYMEDEVVLTPGAIETPQVEEKTDENKPSTVQMVIVISLAVILLLSITSLITLVLINKKNSGIIDNRILENIEDNKK